MQRGHLKQTRSLEERLAEHANLLRQVAALLPHGSERDEIIRKARRFENGSHKYEWLRSLDSQPSSVPPIGHQ